VLGPLLFILYVAGLADIVDATVSNWTQTRPSCFGPGRDTTSLDRHASAVSATCFYCFVNFDESAAH